MRFLAFRLANHGETLRNNLFGNMLDMDILDDRFFE